MDMPLRPACQPRLDLWRPVGRVVVRHQMHFGGFEQVAIQFLEEIQELLCAMALVAFFHNRAGRNRIANLTTLTCEGRQV